jgi:predicted DNA-binding transcriptional regulator AlpA
MRKEDHTLPKMEQRLLSAKELSEYLGISPQTIYNKVNRGNFPIPFKRIFGLLKWEKRDVDEFLNKLTSQPPFQKRFD